MSYNLKNVEQLVFPKYNSSYTTTLALKELQAAYKKADLTVEIVKDNKEVKDCEILVGRTNRTTTDAITDVASYFIGFADNKLIVDGGTPKAINTAVALLTEKVLNGEYIIESEIAGKCSNEAAKVGEYAEVVTDDFTGTELMDIWYKFEERKEPSINMAGTQKTIMTIRTDELIELKDGKLYQRATLDGVEKDGDLTISYTSRPKLTTEKNFWFRYGYTEVSAKVAKGNAIGCSFWLHGHNGGLGTFYCEYDILEIYGNPKYNQFSPLMWQVVEDDTRPNGLRNHSSWYLDTENNISPEYKAKQRYNLENLESLADEFHTYGLEWDEDYYNFTFDGEILMSVKYSDMPEDYPAKKAFTKEQAVDAYRQPVFAVIDLGAGHQGWERHEIGINDMTGNNWVDDNIYTTDYFILYQKPNQFSAESYEEIKKKIGN